MHQTGKRASRQLGATSVAGSIQSHLFSVTEHASGLKFFVNLGANVSVVTRLHTHRKTQRVQAINNTLIPIYVWHCIGVGTGGGGTGGLCPTNFYVFATPT